MGATSRLSLSVFAALLCLSGLRARSPPWPDTTTASTQNASRTDEQTQAVKTRAFTLSEKSTPFANASAVTTTTASQQKKERHKEKMMRIRKWKLRIIQQRIIEGLGFTHKPNTQFTVNEFDFKPWASRQERLQCYHMPCSQPSKTDGTWSNPESNNLRLYFDVDFPRNISVRLISAKLQFHMTATKDDCSCEPSGSQLVVGIYTFKKPLRRGKKIKRRLTAVRMIPRHRSTWLTFNLTNVVNEWIHTKKNFGLEIQVKNEAEEILNAHSIISAPNCSSKNKTIICVPRSSKDDSEEESMGKTPFMLLSSQENNNSDVQRNKTSPVLEVISVEMPHIPPEH